MKIFKVFHDGSKNCFKRVAKIINLPEIAEKTLTYCTRITGATTGGAGAAKGTVDLAEAIACQDGLQICTSFITGPNLLQC